MQRLSCACQRALPGTRKDLPKFQKQFSRDLFLPQKCASSPAIFNVVKYSQSLIRLSASSNRGIGFTCFFINFSEICAKPCGNHFFY